MANILQLSDMFTAKKSKSSRGNSPGTPGTPFASRRATGCRRSHHGRRVKAHDESGLTLIEVTVSFIVLMIVMVPLAYLFTSEVGQAASAKNQLAALGIAEKWVEILSTAQDPPPNSGSLAVDADTPLVPKTPGGVSVPTATVGSTVFHILSEYTWTGTEDASTAPNLCQTGGAQVLNLTVTVSWGNQQVTDTTVLDFPAPGIPQYGFYRLQLAGANTVNDAGLNSWSNRVQAIPVLITNTSTSVANTVYPDQYGCVFAELDPGTYTVSVADPVSSGPPGSTGYGNPSFVENLATNGTASEPTSINVASTTTPPPVTIVAGVTTPPAKIFFDEGSTVGLSYPASTATADGVTCPGANQITCVSIGEGTNGSQGLTQSAAHATLEWTSGSNWSSASPSGTTVTRVASVACAVTTACIGVGYGYTGVALHGVILSDSTTSPGTVTADTVPAAVTSLSNVVCPSPSACVAWGTTASGPVVLAGTIVSGGPDTWNVVGLPAAMTTLNQVVCTPALACVAVGSGGGAGLAASGPIYAGGVPPAAGAWVLSNMTIAGVTALSTISQVACPAALACMATGTGTVAGTNGPVVISAAPAVPANGLGSVLNWTLDAKPAGATPVFYSQLICPPVNPLNTCLVVGGAASQALVFSGPPGVATLTNDSTVPSTTASLSQVVCPSSSVCVAIGSTTSGPVILSGVIAATDTWSAAASIPGSITSVSGISCPNSTTCAIAASTNDVNNNPLAALLSGSPGPSATWSSDTIPTADASTLYLTGISCTPTSGTAICSAVGASSTGPTIMMSTGGPSGAWSDHTADSGLALTGSPVSNIPIELANGGITNTNLTTGYWNPVAATVGNANITSLPDIFPFAGGYGMYAGDCANEDNTGGPGSATVPTTPGNTTSVPGTTVPLQALPLQVNSAAGAPESGDILTLAASTAGCAADTYTLQSTGPDGSSRSEVPFGTYTLTVHVPGGGTNTYPGVIVAPGKVTLGTVHLLGPQPVPVVGP